MTSAAQLIEEIRSELQTAEREIRGHPYLAELAAGRVRRGDLTLFAGEQYHIISYWDTLHALSRR